MAEVLPTLIIFHCNGKEEKKFIEYTVRTGASPFLILFKNIYEKNLVQTLNSFTDKCSALILFSKALLDLTWRIESKEIIEEELPKITRKNVNILLDVSKQDVQRKNINVLSTGYTIDARKLFMKREPNENPRFWKKIEISLRSGDVEKDAHYHNVVEDVAMKTGSVDNCLVTTKICKGHESVCIERLEENTGFLILDKHGNKQLLQCLSVCEEDKYESIHLREKSKTPDIVKISFNYGEITYLEKQIHDEVNEVKKTYKDFEVADSTIEYADDAQFTDIPIDEFENEGHDGIIDNHDDANLLDCSEMIDNAEDRGVMKYENTYDERKNNEISDQENSDIREKIYLKSGCNINVNIVPKKSHDFVVDSKNSIVTARDLTAETWYPIITSNHLHSTTNSVKESTRNEETIDVVQLKSVEHEGNNYIELQCCYEENALYLNADHTLEFYEVLEIDVGSEMTNIIERHRISDAIPLGEPLFDDDEEEKPPVKETKVEEAKPTSNDVPYGGLFYHKTIFAF